MVQVLMLVARYRRSYAIFFALVGTAAFSALVAILLLSNEPLDPSVLELSFYLAVAGVLAIAISVELVRSVKPLWERASELARGLSVACGELRLPWQAKVEVGVLEGGRVVIGMGLGKRIVTWAKFRSLSEVRETRSIDMAELKRPFTLILPSSGGYMKLPAVKLMDRTPRPLVLCYLDPATLCLKHAVLRLIASSGPERAEAVVRLEGRRLRGWLKKAPGGSAKLAKLDLIAELRAIGPEGPIELCFKVPLAIVEEGSTSFSCALGPIRPLLIIISLSRYAFPEIRRLLGVDIGAWGLGEGRYKLRLALLGPGEQLVAEHIAELPIEHLQEARLGVPSSTRS